MPYFLYIHIYVYICNGFLKNCRETRLLISRIIFEMKKKNSECLNCWKREGKMLLVKYSRWKLGCYTEELTCAFLPFPSQLLLRWYLGLTEPFNIATFSFYHFSSSSHISISQHVPSFKHCSKTIVSNRNGFVL